MKGGLVLGCGLSAQSLRLAAAAPASSIAGMTLKVDGSAAQGYGVTLLFNGQAIARHNHGGEFSARFQNEDRSVEDRVTDWKAVSWKGDASHASLEGECRLPNLNTTVFVNVEYELIGPHVVRKKIRLRQSDEFVLFYQLTNRLEPEEPPAKLWSFDQIDWRGGALREYFPVAGFRTKDSVCVGLLTDAGYRNQWTRLIRRDGRPVKPAPQRIPDANLYFGSGPTERARGGFFIQQTFGEITAETGGDGNSKAVALPEIASWKRQGNATIEERESVAIISARSSDDGMSIPFAATGSELYSVRLEYRAAAPASLQIWNIDAQGNKVDDVTLYNDGLPESPDRWTQ